MVNMVGHNLTSEMLILFHFLCLYYTAIQRQSAVTTHFGQK